MEKIKKGLVDFVVLSSPEYLRVKNRVDVASIRKLVNENDRLRSGKL